MSAPYLYSCPWCGAPTQRDGDNPIPRPIDYCVPGDHKIDADEPDFIEWARETWKENERLTTERESLISELMAETTIAKGLRAERDAAVAAEREAREEADLLKKATALCERHAPNGGARAMCVICSGKALHHALSRIDYALGPPNEMGIGFYDVDCDEERVVSEVERLVAEKDAAVAVEREACAQLVEGQQLTASMFVNAADLRSHAAMLRGAAMAIRARGPGAA